MWRWFHSNLTNCCIVVLDKRIFKHFPICFYLDLNHSFKVDFLHRYYSAYLPGWLFTNFLFSFEISLDKDLPKKAFFNFYNRKLFFMKSIFWSFFSCVSQVTRVLTKFPLKKYSICKTLIFIATLNKILVKLCTMHLKIDISLKQWKVTYSCFSLH